MAKEVKFSSFDNRNLTNNGSAQPRGQINTTKRDETEKRKRSQYLVINTRHESSPAERDRMASKRDSLIEKNEKGEFKRVKFESPRLRYDLQELFENPPAFNEPLIKF
jgi:hypothetical protein